MSRWDETAVLADSASLTAGTPATADTASIRDPTVLVKLEGLEGNADDTVTIEIVGEAATYQMDQRTLSSLGTYSVDIPQAESVELTSSNGVTYSAEVRANPR